MRRGFAAIAATAWMLAAVMPGVAKAVEPTSTAKQETASTPGMGMFARPVVLRGMLGDKQIQVNLHPKVEYEGVEGEYFRFGESSKILLAGETDGEELVLEESENGTDVSGQWEGKRKDSVIEGVWQSADGSVSKPFKLTMIGASAAEKPQLSNAKPSMRMSSKAR